MVDKIEPYAYDGLQLSELLLQGIEVGAISISIAALFGVTISKLIKIMMGKV